MAPPLDMSNTGSVSGSEPKAASHATRQGRGWHCAAAAMILLATLMVSGCHSVGPAPLPGPTPMAGLNVPRQPSAVPEVVLSVLADGLKAPSSLASAPDGTILITSGDQIVRYSPDGALSTLAHHLSEVAHEGPGLIDIVLAPTFPADAHAYLCHRTYTDVRVVALAVNRELTRAVLESVLLTGLRYRHRA